MRPLFKDLLKASEEGNFVLVKKLLADGVDVNGENGEGKEFCVKF